MRKSSLFILIWLCFFFLKGTPAFPQQQKLQEEVTVTAVEVPVRVYLQDQVLKGLAREDFEVFENGIKQDLTDFEAVSRKIAGAVETETGRPKKRIFILIFNIFDYTEGVGEGIDVFFRDYFQPGDQFIIFVENQVLNIEAGRSLEQVIQNLKDTLKRFKMISLSSTLKNFRNLKYEGDRVLDALRSQEQGIFSIPQAMMRFFENYRRIWEEYRKQYLIPDISRLEPVLRRVKMIEGEKWALCFQQREMFPRLKQQGSLDTKISDWVGSQVNPEDQTWARLIQAKQSEMHTVFDVLEYFPAQSLKDLFLASNISFHLILLKSLRYIHSDDFELREVPQDYENTLKAISASTGGASLFSNAVSESLKMITEKEDHYYLLVYSPKNVESQKKREIEVKVNRPGARVVYLNHIPERKAPPVSINDFKAGRQAISFTIKSFQRREVEGKMMGMIEVKVRLYGQDSRLAFDEGNMLGAIKDEVKISLNLSGLKQGKYFIILEVVDRVSAETDVFSAEIEI